MNEVHYPSMGTPRSQHVLALDPNDPTIKTDNFAKGTTSPKPLGLGFRVRGLGIKFTCKTINLTGNLPNCISSTLRMWLLRDRVS